MSLNHTPSAERIHIGIFGRRNAGKSSLINALTNQKLAIVSDVKGTTTDPVLKAMELLPLGPVVLIDTPGLDDIGSLGKMRVKKAYEMLNKTDIALLVLDASTGMTPEDQELLEQIQKKNIPYGIVWNKIDLLTRHTETHTLQTPFAQAQEPQTQKLKTPEPHIQEPKTPEPHTPKPVFSTKTTAPTAPKPQHFEIHVSARTQEHIEELKHKIASLVPSSDHPRQIVGDLLKPGDFVVLVVPIDSSAPKGRLILPQQQTIRDILDAQATAIVVKDTELKETLDKLGALVKLVVTDSQVFQQVSQLVPPNIPLTSFSILFARYKGNLEIVTAGAYALDQLQDDDTILISEGCTHHRQCDDIGTVKLPKLLRKYTGKNLNIEFTSGTEFPEVIHNYRMIIHCGGCMLNEREMKYRLQCAQDQGVPITNYGTAIAHMNGILERSLELFS